jgi:dynein heavy chain
MRAQVAILSPDWKQLILRLCLFHAAVAERLQYREQGWRRSYEFTAADMLSAVQQVMSLQPSVAAGPSTVGGGLPLAGGGLGGASLAGLSAAAALDAVLPGLSHVVGQCLYGGKVTDDWDRRLLRCLLSQQLTPQHDPACATADALLPPRLVACGGDLSVLAKDLRGLAIPRDDPFLVGLPPGAAAVRAAQRTRHVLDTLKRVQLLRSGGGGGPAGGFGGGGGGEDPSSDLTRPLQLALSVCQDLVKHLPVQPLPATRSGWVAHVGAAGGAGSGAAVGARARTAGAKSASPTGAAAGSSPAALPAAAPPPPPSTPSPAAHVPGMPRYKAVKMTEAMSPAALERWEGLAGPLRRSLAQVFADELGSLACVLAEVHAAVRTVSAVSKGLEAGPSPGGAAELVWALAQVRAAAPPGYRRACGAVVWRA